MQLTVCITWLSLQMQIEEEYIHNMIITIPASETAKAAMDS